MTTAKRFALAVLALLMAGAVAQELRKPAGARTWRGRVAGVPYDLRVPTPARIKQGFWAPGDDRLIIERGPFGLGWGVNLAKFVGR